MNNMKYTLIKIITSKFFNCIYECDYI